MRSIISPSTFQFASLTIVTTENKNYHESTNMKFPWSSCLVFPLSMFIFLLSPLDGGPVKPSYKL